MIIKLFRDVNKEIAPFLNSLGIEKRQICPVHPSELCLDRYERFSMAVEWDGSRIGIKPEYWCTQFNVENIAQYILAHEYGHILYRTTTVGFMQGDPIPLEEGYCDYFAAYVGMNIYGSYKPFEEFLRETHYSSRSNPNIYPALQQSLESMKRALNGAPLIKPIDYALPT